MKTLALPAAFHPVTHLGTLEQVFPPRFRNLNIWVSGFVALAGLGGSGYFAVGGILNTVDRYYRFGPAILMKTLVFPLMTALFLLMIGLFAAVRGWQRNRYWAALYTGGVAIQTPSRLVTWRWEDFSSVKLALLRKSIFGIPSGIEHVYTFTAVNGETFTIDDRCQAVSDLAEEIQTHTTPLIYTRAARAYKSGESQSFGAVTLSRVGGLLIDHQSVPWDDLVSVTVERGVVNIKTRSQQELRVMVETVKNLDVFISLVDPKKPVQVETPDHHSR